MSVAALIISAAAIGTVFSIPGQQGKTARYSPAAQTRSIDLTVIPDATGDGYDIFTPGTVTVNQGDTVQISVRNLDTMQHGISIDAFKVNTNIPPATEGANSTVTPSATTLPSFVASTPGIYTIYCSVPCGPGHMLMKATLVVLATG